MKNLNETHEKEQNIQAKKIINEKYLSDDVQLTFYDEYRILSDSKKLKAIEFYKTHQNSIDETLKHIKEI